MNIFQGTMPALMTTCGADGTPDFDALVGTRAQNSKVPAAKGDAAGRALTVKPNDALAVLSKYVEGPDLVLYCKHLMVLEGRPEYRHQINRSDCLSRSRQAFLEQQ